MMKSIKPSAIVSRPRRVRKAVQKEPFTIETGSLASSSSASAAKPTRRKRSATETDDNTSSAMNLAAVITGAASSIKYSPIQQKAHSRPLPTPFTCHAAVSTDDTTPSPASSTSATRRQRLIAENRSRPLMTIKCRSCEATDIPLMLGGRQFVFHPCKSFLNCSQQVFVELALKLVLQAVTFPSRPTMPRAALLLIRHLIFRLQCQ